MNKFISFIAMLALTGQVFAATTTSTGEKILAGKKGSSTNVTLEANTNSANKPKLIYDKVAAKWKFSNDGTTSKDFGSGSGGGGGGVNLLTSDENPGFEEGTSGWTASGGSFTLETSAPLFGAQSAIFDASALNQTLSSTAKTVVEGLKGQNCLAMISYKYSGSSGDYKLQVYDGTNVLAEQGLDAATIASDAYVGFGCPTTGTVLVRVIAAVSNPGAITIDGTSRAGGSIQLGSNVLLAQVAPISNWELTSGFTATGAGSPTITAYTRRVGDTWEIRGYILLGTVSAADGSLILPSGKTIDTGKLGSAISQQAVGYWNLVGGGASQNINTDYASGQSPMFYDGSTNDRIFFTRTTLNGTSPTSQYDKTDGNVLWNNTGTNVVAFYIWGIPITGWSSNVSTLSTVDSAGQSWSGYHASDCSWARTNTAYGDPTADSTCTFTQRSSQGMGAVTSYLSGSDKLPGIVLSPSKAAVYFACAGYQVSTLGADGAVGAVELSDTSGFVIGEKEFVGYSGSIKRHSQTICGLYPVSAAGTKTLRLRTKHAASDATIAVNGQGNTSVEWTIFNVTNQLPMPYLIDTLTSGAGSAERVFRVRMAQCTSDPCTIIDQGGGTWLTGISWLGTGDYRLNIATGIFSATPTCVVQKRGQNGTTSNQKIWQKSLSATDVRVRATDSSGSTGQDSAEGFEMICMGPK